MLYWLTKSGGFLVGYSYQLNSWADAEGNYGYTQNTLNTLGSFRQPSIRSEFHEMTRAFVAHIPVSLERTDLTHSLVLEH